jgi:hypothetical protein
MPGLREFLDFLRREYVPGARTTLGLSALPDGEAFYQHRIRMHTTLELSPQEVHDTGLREVARVREAMEQVKRHAGFAGSLAEFMTSPQTDPRFTAATGAPAPVTTPEVRLPSAAPTVNAAVDLLSEVEREGDVTRTLFARRVRRQ